MNRHTQRTRIFCASAIATIMLSACGGGSNSSLPTPPPVAEKPTAPSINQAKPFNSPLVKAGSARFSRYLKNGVYSTNQTGPLVSIELTPTASDSKGYSTTNTQESDVDEADRIEYDGEYMYVAGYPQWQAGRSYEASLRVLQRQADFSLQAVAKVPLSLENANIEGLYLHQNRLAMIANDTPMYEIASLVPQPGNSQPAKVQVSVFDTSDPANLNSLAEMQIEGWLLSTRRTGDYMYVVTSYTAGVEGLKMAAGSEVDKLANYNKINSTEMAKLMPKLTLNGTAQPMNQPQDCYIPEQATQKDGYAQLVTITRINMQQPDQHQSVCLSAVADTLYMSSDNLYLATLIKNDTVLHKISLQQSFDYQATGSVPGRISGRGQPNLRLSEADNNLRIVTSTYDKEGKPTHKLYVLQQQQNDLKVVGELPNDAQPEPIGKPGEEIYAVRFLGDKGYIVTFERIDPLYVIDLSDANNPRTLGSLEIPGYSSYLHPIGQNYLLGVGQEVQSKSIPQTGTVAVNPPIIATGMKVSLFDVSDPSAPKEVNNLVVKDGYTPVEYDYRALSVLQRDGKYQFALPVERWVKSEQSQRGRTLTNSLLMVEVNPSQAAPSLTEIHQMKVEKKGDQAYVYSGNDRSVMHNQHVYYLNGNQIWHSQWLKGAAINGPY